MGLVSGFEFRVSSLFAIFSTTRRHVFVGIGAEILPLPKGEGRGEGERVERMFADIRSLAKRLDCARFSAAFLPLRLGVFAPLR